MNAFALIAIVLISCTSASVHRRSHNNAPGRLRRAETVTQAEKDLIQCVTKTCPQKYANVIAALQDIAAINEEKLNNLCEYYGRMTACTESYCTVTSEMKEVLNLFAVVGFVCDNHKNAFLKHGSCLFNAMQGSVLEAGCDSLLTNHTASGGTFHFLTPTARYTFLQEFEDMDLEAQFTPFLIKTKHGVRAPAFDCPKLQLLDQCVKKRVNDLCNEDESGEAAELSSALFKEFMTRLANAVKGLQPESDIPDMAGCLAGSSSTFRFWFW